MGGGWSTPRPGPLYRPERDAVTIVQEAGWARGPVWTGGKTCPYRDSIPGLSSPQRMTIATQLLQLTP
jgi:hypothetical protein